MEAPTRDMDPAVLLASCAKTSYRQLSSLAYESLSRVAARNCLVVSCALLIDCLVDRLRFSPWTAPEDVGHAPGMAHHRNVLRAGGRMAEGTRARVVDAASVGGLRRVCDRCVAAVRVQAMEAIGSTRAVACSVDRGCNGRKLTVFVDVPEVVEEVERRELRRVGVSS